jgi:hypothetical protein
MYQFKLYNLSGWNSLVSDLAEQELGETGGLEAPLRNCTFSGGDVIILCVPSTEAGMPVCPVPGEFQVAPCYDPHTALQAEQCKSSVVS